MKVFCVRLGFLTVGTIPADSMEKAAKQLGCTLKPCPHSPSHTMFLVLPSPWAITEKEYGHMTIREEQACLDNRVDLLNALISMGQLQELK